MPLIVHHAMLSAKRIGTKLAIAILLIGCGAPADTIEVSVVDGVRQDYLRYPSDGLMVTGWLFTDPDDDLRRPLMIFNHGGVGGVGNGTKQLCRSYVKEGFTVFAPSYRGEDDGEGEIEVAVGEVDDVVNAIPYLARRPQVDARNLVLAGTSHGALISLKAACRPEICERLKGVVAGYGVTQIYDWYQYLLDNDFDVRDPLSLRVYGEGPQDKPEAFAERHLPNFLDELCEAPILVLQGAKDEIVPPSQAESLREELEQRGRSQDRVLVFETGGHGFLFWDDPELHDADKLAEAEEARRIMREFLKQQAGIGDS